MYAAALTIDGPLVILMCILLGSMLERHFKVLDVLASSSEARRLVCSTVVALLTGMSVASVTLTAVVGTAAANSSQLAGCAATAIKLAQLTFVAGPWRTRHLRVVFPHSALFDILASAVPTELLSSIL